ncbi:MAG: S8 family serine peptidase [Acidobacteria bacterium]|nr:S8 family serine peptidase [Acidobacteriota bacterium]
MRAARPSRTRSVFTAGLLAVSAGLPVCAAAPVDLVVITPAPAERGPSRWRLVDESGGAVVASASSAALAAAPVGPGADPLAPILERLAGRDLAVARTGPSGGWLLVRAEPDAARGLLVERGLGLVGRLGTREPLLKFVRPTLGVSGAWEAAGRGRGSRVGVVEIGAIGQVADVLRVDQSFGPCSEEQAKHAVQVAGVIGLVGHNGDTRPYGGIAPRALLLDAGACSNSDAELIRAMTWAVERGAHVLNLSWGAPTAGKYDALAAAVDDLAWRSGALIVAAAGNDGASVLSPGLAHSVLTVGATDDNRTGRTDDDHVASFSSWLDPVAGYAKPEVVAPGVDVVTASPGTQALSRGSGTSLAAPAVAAIAALAVGKRPELAGHGETLRALLLVAAGQRVDVADGERPGARDGEGYVRAKVAAKIARAGRFGWTMLGAAERGLRVQAARVKLARGERLRAAIAWSQPGAYHAAGEATMADFDLAASGPDGEPLAESRGIASSWELVDFVAPRKGYYELSVHVVRHDAVDATGATELPTPVGLAWNTVGRSNGPKPER